MKYEYDVIVAGGGVAGCAAALSAVREGKSVLLIEKTLTFGGLGTIGLINFFVPMCNGRGKAITKGMCAEFVELSKKYGWAFTTEEWKNGEPTEKTNARYMVRYSPNIFALALSEILYKEGVTILLDSVVSEAETEIGEIKRIRVTNKTGDEWFAARIFIDATGDADLCKYAGAPTVDGENYYTYIAFGATLESCRRAVEENSIGKLYTNFNGGKSTLYGRFHPEGMKKFGGTTGEEVTEYVLKNQMDLIENIKNQDPDSRDIVTLPTMPQFRTTRHIQGMYTLKTDDAYKHFDDSICLINDFDRRDFLYEVPLRCLIAENTKNLLAVGRCACAEGYAWDVLRVIPPAILTGQAAGVAACHAIDENTDIQNVNITRLQKKLESKNVLIHMTKELMPEEI
ncbi:MAG: FAD-dependent oxidoreductase [Clostridia bacterium]|nr:FAD-dependent oxidoreductase [Clostridia bacterium]MBQ5771092.1 FAD-dependent oxidoreductase [Clostridia bacterium]